MYRKYSKYIVLIALFFTGCAANKTVTVDPNIAAIEAEKQRQEQEKQNQLIADFQSAVGMLDQGELSEAKKLLLSITESSSRYSGPYINLGTIAEKEGDQGAALQHYQKALEINPGNVVAYNKIGLLKRKEGQFQDAVHYFRQGLNVDSGNADLNYNLAVVYELYLQEYELAKSHYQKYLSNAKSPDENVKKWLVGLDRK